MKKIFILLIVFLQFEIYGQNFRDTYWGMDIEFLNETKNIIFVNSDEYIESAVIANEKTNISYFFDKNKLIATGYSISFSDNALIYLKNSLTKKYGTPKMLLYLDFYKKINDVDKKKQEFKEFIKQQNKSEVAIMFDDLKGYNNLLDSLIGHVINNGKKQSTDDPLALIHYITRNTDIYVISDIIPDKIVVIYAEHEDDF